MQIVADFHLHSLYSRATSKQMNLEGLAKGAKIKGLNLLGTGDLVYSEYRKIKRIGKYIICVNDMKIVRS